VTESAVQSESADGLAATGTDAVALIRFNLLGAFRILLLDAGNREAEARLGETLGRKAQALLAYLAAMPGHRASRERLASLLWGERFDEQARQSLRQTLMALRRSLQTLAPGLLVIDRSDVGLATGCFTTDLADFERAAALPDTQNLQAAAALWRGDFLAGLDIPSPEYEDWLRVLRDTWHLRRIAAQMRLAQHLLDAGAGHDALLAVTALVDLDPLNEAARRLELVIVARFSGTAAALKRYQRFVGLLDSELGVAPEMETRALVARLGESQLGAVQAGAVQAGAVQAETGQVAILDAAAAITTIKAEAVVVSSPWRRFSAAATAMLAVAVLAGGIAWHLSHGEQDVGVRPPMSFHVTAHVTATGNDAGGAFRETLKTRLALLPFASLATEPRSAAFTIEAAASPAGQQNGPSQVVSLRLIDAASGRTVWADSQAVAPDAIERVAASGAVRLYVELLAHLQQRRGPPPPIAPALQPGWDAVAKGITRQGVAEGRRFFQAAVDAAPQDAGAHLGLAHYISLDLVNRWSREREADILRATASLDHALQQMPRSTTAYFTIGVIHKSQRDYARSLAAFEVVLAIDPRDSLANSQVAHIQLLTGNISEGVARAEMAIQLHPNSRAIDRAYFYAGMGHLLAGDYVQAERRLARAIAANPHLPDSYVWRVSALAQAGRQAEAEALYAEMMKRFPWWNVDHHLTQVLDRSVMDRFVAGLAKVAKPG
jgi:DNA-binding SARP family transcriptional activator/tetratricopeptide (TPR) repeat protein